VSIQLGAVVFDFKGRDSFALAANCIVYIVVSEAQVHEIVDTAIGRVVIYVRDLTFCSQTRVVFKAETDATTSATGSEYSGPRISDQAIS